MEVSEAEVDGCSQISLNVVDRVGEDKGIAVEENLGFDLPRKDNQVLRECSKISEHGGLAETTSFVDNPLPGDHMDFKSKNVPHLIYMLNLFFTLVKLLLTFLVNLQQMWKWQRLKRKYAYNQMPV